MVDRTGLASAKGNRSFLQGRCWFARITSMDQRSILAVFVVPYANMTMRTEKETGTHSRQVGITNTDQTNRRARPCNVRLLRRDSLSVLRAISPIGHDNERRVCIGCGEAPIIYAPNVKENHRNIREIQFLSFSFRPLAITMTEMMIRPVRIRR